jgi:hypothetical protein
VKGCALFAALFLTGIGLVVGGIVYDSILNGAPFQEPAPFTHKSTAPESDAPRILEVSGIAVAFLAIFGAAGWGFYRRQRDPEVQGSDER